MNDKTGQNKAQIDILTFKQTHVKPKQMLPDV